MPYNEKLAHRIREALALKPHVREREMFGGLIFMMNNKACAGVIGDDMMCRIDPCRYEEVLEKEGCRPMDFTGMEVKGWVFVDASALRQQTIFEYWIQLCVAFNKKANRVKRK